MITSLCRLMGVSTKPETQISLMFVGVGLVCYLFVPPSRQHLPSLIHLKIWGEGSKAKKTPNKQKRRGEKKQTKTTKQQHIRCLCKVELQIIEHLATSSWFLTKRGSHTHKIVETCRHSTEKMFRQYYL